MKRALSIAASVILFAGMSFAAETKSTTGNITPIVIGPTFSMDLAGWYVSSDGTTETKIGDLTGGNLNFGTTVDLTTNGIFKTAGATGANAYKATEHRAAPYFDYVQFWIKNNAYKACTVKVTVAGDILSLVAPTGATESVMHVTADKASYKYKVNGVDVDGSTLNESFIQNKGNPNPVFANIGINLWVDNNDVYNGDDVFMGIFALDNLPLTIPNNTYEGTVTYDLIGA